MMAFDYWKEAVAESLSEAGVHADDAQLESIASNMRPAHENIGMAFHVPENPLIGELAETKKKLAREQDTFICRHCNGAGGFGSRDDIRNWEGCYKCKGKGSLYRDQL